MTSKEESLVESIANEYSQITAATLQTWVNNPSIGAPRPLPDGYYKFGISVGSFFQPTARLKPLFQELENLAGIDANHVTIPSTSFHFTFLALAGHEFDAFQALPPEVAELTEVCRKILDFKMWRLDQLRVLPGANFLLLVGMPSSELVELREKFAAALLDSSWKRFIQSRHEYRGYPFPPKIWHTTLCRYKAEFLPRETRQLYERYRNQTLGAIELEVPRLRRVNYDWSSTSLID